MIALMVTVIVLLILAGISVSMLTGNNGLISKAGDAKGQAEIAEERDIIEEAVFQARKNDKFGELKASKIQSNINDITGLDESKIKVYSEENGFYVYFKEKNRIYNVDEDGKVKQEDSSILIADSEPGKFDGTGTAQDPFIIMSIEDLVYLSQDANEHSNKYTNKIYVKLGRNLDFKSELSYFNYETTAYSVFLGVPADVGLMEALTNESYAGFKPIANFKSTFNGDGKSLKNIYEKREGNAGLFEILRKSN